MFRRRASLHSEGLLGAAPLVWALVLTGVAVSPQSAHDVLQPLVLENVRLVDGTGGPAVAPARIVLRGGRIEAAGPASSVPAVPGSTSLDLAGRTVLPGLVDMHFHIEDDPKLALRQLANGVTSFRDPGEWFEKFEPLKSLMATHALAGPRMFLCGPHIDGENPAYPEDAFVARDPDEARRQASRAIAEGATAIKIYYRLPLASARAVVDVCRDANVPCTAHLEILDARDLLQVGLTGLEHVTSFGTAIVPLRRAEIYRQAVLKDNAFRRDGRYALFAEADLGGPDARELYRVVAERRPFVDPTLAVYEARATDRPPKGSALTSDVRARGFLTMKRLVERLHASGARIVLGGHTSVPHAGRGEAPWRELELLVESGLTPMDAVVAATRNGAAFLGRASDLGTLEPGKRADLIVVDGDPLTDIQAIRRVNRVMVEGRWIDIEQFRKY